MAFWKRKAAEQSVAAGADSAAVDDEQAVLIRITELSDRDAGLDVVEDPIIEAIGRAGVGEFDGNEVGPDGATLYMYGPDADALWAAIEPEVRRAPLGAGSHALCRYGGPGAQERRIELG